MTPRLFLTVAAAVLLVAAPCFAQTRPLLVEEATTGPGGKILFETGLDYIASEPNFLTGKERDRWAGPLARFVFSPASNVEIDVEWVVRVWTSKDPDFGGVSDAGDVTLRSKVRLHDGGARGPTVGARFAVGLPETNTTYGLGPDALRVSAQMLLTQPLGRGALHLNAGLAIHDKPFGAHEQRDFVAYGAAVEHPVGARISVLGEVSGLAGAESPGAERHAELRFGLRYSLSRLRLDAALRRGLTDADGTWGVTAGLAWTVREGRVNP